MHQTACNVGGIWLQSVHCTLYSNTVEQLWNDFSGSVRGVYDCCELAMSHLSLMVKFFSEWQHTWSKKKTV